MADRYAEPDDAAVDELKRKARRRLVGAIVLALVAAVVVPMLLEREPRPLGDEVSVQIPPVDDGKFINRLTDPKAEAAKAAKSPVASGGAASGAKSVADAEQRVLAPPAHPPVASAIPPDEKASASAAAKQQEPAPSLPAAVAKIEAPKQEAPKQEAPKQEAPKQEAPKQEAPKQEAPKQVPAKQEPPKQASSASPSAPAATSVANGSGFVVQLAAFADDKGANALAGKLKRAGYPAYTEAVHTSRGTLWRVRVGSYPSRDAASSAQIRLKGDGYSGIVAAVR
jgi:DedD protein